MNNKKNNKLMEPMLLSRRNAQILRDSGITKKQLGMFFMVLLGYQSEGKMPDNVDPVVLALWKVIRADMKREFGEGVR